jgi:DNA-binding NarL/FixJ family response regulator
MIRIYLVDDHAVVIEGIYAMLQHEKDIEMSGYATNAENCLYFLTHHSTEVILMDISLPDMNGIDLCALVRKKWPNVKVLALSTFHQGTYVRRMMEAGASGYLLKNAGKHEFTEAIRTVSHGKTYFSNEARQALRSDSQLQHAIPPLTKREKEILTLIADGLTNSQMAERLFISVDTVDSHRKNLYTKLNVKNTAMLIRLAIESHLI